MQRITLEEFATKVGQEKAASVLGLTQGGVSKAIRTGRVIYVVELADGSFVAEEVRPFPGQKAISARSSGNPATPEALSHAS